MRRRCCGQGGLSARRGRRVRARGLRRCRRCRPTGECEYHSNPSRAGGETYRHHHNLPVQDSLIPILRSAEIPPERVRDQEPWHELQHRLCVLDRVDAVVENLRNNRDRHGGVGVGSRVGCPCVSLTSRGTRVAMRDGYLGRLLTGGSAGSVLV